MPQNSSFRNLWGCESLKKCAKKPADIYLDFHRFIYALLLDDLQVPSNGDQSGNRYNIQVINALVMHVGTSAIQYIRSKGKMERSFRRVDC